MTTRIISFLGALVVFALVWSATSRLISPGATVAANRTVPPPTLVLKALFAEPFLYIENGNQTALASLGGLVVAGIIAVVITFSVAIAPRSEVILYPYLTMLKASPAVAYVPVFIALVGSGLTARMLTAAMISFFPLVVGSLDGLHRVPERLSVVAAGLGARRLRFFSVVSSRYALSGLLSGLKTAAPLSVIGAIVGEYVGGGRGAGIGAFIGTNYREARPVLVFAGVVVATIIGIVYFTGSYVLANATERRLHLGR